MPLEDALEIIAIVFGAGLVVGFLVFVFVWGCEF
jgi:hypothetical protein